MFQEEKKRVGIAFPLACIFFAYALLYCTTGSTTESTVIIHTVISKRRNDQTSQCKGKGDQDRTSLTWVLHYSMCRATIDLQLTPISLQFSSQRSAPAARNDKTSISRIKWLGYRLIEIEGLNGWILQTRTDLESPRRQSRQR